MRAMKIDDLAGATAAMAAIHIALQPRVHEVIIPLSNGNKYAMKIQASGMEAATYFVSAFVFEMFLALQRKP